MHTYMCLDLPLDLWLQLRVCVCVCVCVCLTEQFCCIAEIKHSIVNQLYYNNLKKIAEDLSQPPEATSEEGKSLSL